MQRNLLDFGHYLYDYSKLKWVNKGFSSMLRYYSKKIPKVFMAERYDSKAEGLAGRAGKML